MYTINDIRNYFIADLAENRFVIDKTGCKMLEMIGVAFDADQEAIFGKPNQDYIERETFWYLSQSLRVDDIPAPIPAVWKSVASRAGFINSNYGFLLFNSGNHFQYKNVVKELKSNPYSRRAIAIYTRPTMHYEYNLDGMNDFICTNTVQYFIRDGKLHTVVNMRSNDVVFGYKNDRAWQLYVQEILANELFVEVGDLIWQVGSLHVYEKHFDLVTA